MAIWISRAPSNIALIKYMGKSEGNIPCNGSLSYTLHKFETEVSLELCRGQDVFEDRMGLGARSVERFLEHLKRLKQLTGCGEFFHVKSRNNFPHSAGIASSASSFAALTICAFNAMGEIQNSTPPSPEEMSRVSRLASGSSCRSFFSPWCFWEGENARKIDIKIDDLMHDLLLVNGGLKAVSSGEAHRLVKSSLLFPERAQRAKIRLEKLMKSMNDGDWSGAHQLCWEEFWDMHALFETSCPSFGYMTADTIAVLSGIRKFWKTRLDGPLTTVDAGCNVHLLWRRDQTELQQRMRETICADMPGVGIL
jgi:diphosphomevalonate decarboxylase